MGNVMKKIAIYARVSTDKQTCENQLIELRVTAERMGYEIVSEYLDEGISGAKSRQDRPAALFSTSNLTDPESIAKKKAKR
jgi:DNA invertase Pin-like site-specific DNA recombinase